RAGYATIIDGPKNTGKPVTCIVLTSRPTNLVWQRFGTFAVQSCAVVFRSVFISATLNAPRSAGILGSRSAHAGTLRNTMEQVNTQNFGSEGWGFESLQARTLR